MNTRHCILRLLLVFVCLFVLFSHSLTAYATDNISYFMGNEVSFSYLNEYSINTLTLELENGYKVYSYYRLNGSEDTWHNFDSTCSLEKDILYDFYFLVYLPETISKSTMFNVTLDIYKSGLRSFSSGSVDFYRPNSSDFFTFNDLSMETVGTSNNRYTSNSDITASHDIDRFQFFFSATGSFTGDVTVYPVSIDITEVSSNGLLGNIITFVRNIWTGLIELPMNIANRLKQFFQNIVDSVVELGNTILEGIKNLFIPSQEDITEMKDKWDTLLSDRFGALYQVGALISDYAAAFTEQSKGTITFPSITIPLAGAEFTFGGWEVQVVPDGFGVVFDTLKLITSILATLLFANGLKKRFDKLLGGADDI